jgi:ribosomal protein L37AE/L43A
MSSRAAPNYCPYCAEEDLRPHEESHGAWECRACQRVFSVKFLGLRAEGFSSSNPRTEEVV